MRLRLLAASVLLIIAASFAFAAEFYQPGDKAAVYMKGKWYPAEVLKRKKNSYLVHFEGYDNRYDRWVTLNMIYQYDIKAKDSVLASPAPGSPMEKAQVVKISANLCHVKFERSGALKWLSLDKVYQLTYKRGDMVLAQKNGSWYEGRIKQTGEGRFLIDFKNYDSSYDDWISAEKLKKLVSP